MLHALWWHYWRVLWHSPIITISKLDGLIKSLSLIAPWMGDLIDWLGGARFISTLDLTKIYGQMAITPVTHPKTLSCVIGNSSVWASLSSGHIPAADRCGPLSAPPLCCCTPRWCDHPLCRLAGPPFPSVSHPGWATRDKTHCDPRSASGPKLNAGLGGAGEGVISGLSHMPFWAWHVIIDCSYAIFLVYWLWGESEKICQSAKAENAFWEKKSASFPGAYRHPGDMFGCYLKFLNTEHHPVLSMTIKPTSTKTKTTIERETLLMKLNYYLTGQQIVLVRGNTTL